MDYQDAEFCCYNLDARAFFSEFSKERARRRDRCGWSRSASLRDGGDPAAGPYGERKATPGKPLKNALGGCSSVGQSTWLRTKGSWVRILPAAPLKCLKNNPLSRCGAKGVFFLRVPLEAITI